MQENILAKLPTIRCCFFGVCYTARHSWDDAGKLTDLGKNVVLLRADHSK